jgi:hypothetical protein
MPDLRAFIEERALPAGVRGPVDLRALRRLAAICFWVAIRGEDSWMAQGWGAAAGGKWVKMREK